MVERQLRHDGRTEIFLVLRIFCPVNHKKRAENGESFPYTARVIPSFLVPWSRGLFADIFDAVSRHLQGLLKNQIEASVDLGVENLKSFSRYLRRTLERLPTWCDRASRLILELGGRAPEPLRPVTMNGRYSHILPAWRLFCACLNELDATLQRNTTMRTTVDIREYFFDRMNAEGLGFGPCRSPPSCGGGFALRDFKIPALKQNPQKPGEQNEL